MAMNKKSNKTNLKQVVKKPEIQRPALFENDKLIYFLLAIVLLFVLFARIHLLSFPLERDEGEYAYMGRLILQGHPPYTLAYNMKLPGTYYMYAIIMSILGESTVGIHLGLALMTMVSMVLLFLISKDFVSKISAVIATASFGIIGTSWNLLGQAAHATHFVIFYALFGVFVLLRIYKTEKNKTVKYFLAGLFFSLAFICKQSGLFFVVFGAAIIIIKEFKQRPISSLIKNLTIFSVGFFTPIFIMLAYIYCFGDFNKFWFWTVEYLSKYGNQVPLSEAMTLFKNSIQMITAGYSTMGYISLWILSLIGIPFIFFTKTSMQNKIIIFAFFIFSFLTVVPGFHFREHYFVTLLPAMSLTIAVFFEFVNNLLSSKFNIPNLAAVGFLVFLILVGTGIKANTAYLFTQEPEVSCKLIYGSNPFVESIQVAEFLKQNTNKDDKIAVLGSEPEICFYADRYSASGYIYTYNLVELHSYALSMQKQMIKEIEASKPKYFVSVNISKSWLAPPNSETYIFKWANEFVKDKYTLVGLYDVLQNDFSSLKIHEQMNNYTPLSQDVIYIFERNK